MSATDSVLTYTPLPDPSPLDQVVVGDSLILHIGAAPLDTVIAADTTSNSVGSWFEDSAASVDTMALASAIGVSESLLALDTSPALLTSKATGDVVVAADAVVVERVLTRLLSDAVSVADSWSGRCPLSTVRLYTSVVYPHAVTYATSRVEAVVSYESIQAITTLNS